MTYHGVERYLKILLITYLAILTVLVSGCTEPEPETVLVTFEIQLINARGDYSYGVVGGEEPARGGFGYVNEVIKESLYADVGDEVFAWVRGSQFSSTEPGHQVICRILVHGEEIYLYGDQGTSSQDTQAQCRGPVYIPSTPTPNR